MRTLIDHLMNLNESTQRADWLDEAVELAAGSTSLPMGAGVMDLVGLMGEFREKLVKIIRSGQTACLTVAMITNNFGDVLHDLTIIEAHRDMHKEQLTIVQTAAKNGWEFGLFSKYIQLAKIHWLEGDQELFRSAPLNNCLPVFFDKLQIIKVDPLEIQPIDNFLKAINQKSRLKFKLVCCGVAIHASSFNWDQTEEEIRAEINRFLVLLHYILSICAKLSPQPGEETSLEPANLCDELERLRLRYQENMDQGIVDQIAEAVYSVVLTVAPEKLLYSRTLIRQRLAGALRPGGGEIENQWQHMVTDRLRFDHKFTSLNNAWCFSEWVESVLNRFAGKYYIYSDIHNLALGGQFHHIRSYGIKTPLIDLTHAFMQNEMDGVTFIQSAFSSRLQGEVLINRYFAELSRYWLDEEQTIPCFYVEVGDQVQGIVSDYNTAIRAFMNASHAVGYRLKSGLGIVKIEDHAGLDELRRMAEFGLDVTKLFKNTHQVWEKYQLVGEPFSYGKSVAVLNLFGDKMKNFDANASFLRRVNFNQNLWIHHCHPKLRTEMEMAFSEINARFTHERVGI